jgi:carbamoyl-phosphate synthase large subunit
MKTILITGIGGDVAQGVATIVRECRPEFRLIGTDIHVEHGGELYVDAVFRVPRAEDAGYLSSLTSLIEREGVDIVIPTSEAELAAIGPLMHQLGKARWITSGYRAIAAGVDKLATVQMLRRLGLPAPWTIRADEALPESYPCILKDRFGSGSRSVLMINDVREAESISRVRPKALFQELLRPVDREITCAVYRTQADTIGVLQMLRRLSGGLTTWARVIRDDAVERTCEVLARGLVLQGSMNVQMKLTDQGPRVFEINPRFSSTVLMRHKLGFTDVIWALDELEGRPVKFPEVPEGRVVVRTQSAAVLR